MLKQHIEFVTKVHNLKEKQSAKGWLYSFSVPISSNDKDGNQLTEWLNCMIFLKERDPRIAIHTGEFHFGGELKVSAAWNDRPQKLSLFGFEITPVLGNVYRVAKPKTNTHPEPNSHHEEPPQGYNTGNGMNNPSRMQEEAYKKHDQPQAEFPEMNEEIPF